MEVSSLVLRRGGTRPCLFSYQLTSNLIFWSFIDLREFSLWWFDFDETVILSYCQGGKSDNFGQKKKEKISEYTDFNETKTVISMDAVDDLRKISMEEFDKSAGAADN